MMAMSKGSAPGWLGLFCALAVALPAAAETGTGRVVDLGAGQVGYVEPIYMKPLRVTCHGKKIDPDLLAHIRERYPDDRAVDFEPGEFRGLFWVVSEVRSK